VAGSRAARRQKYRRVAFGDSEIMYLSFAGVGGRTASASPSSANSPGVAGEHGTTTAAYGAHPRARLISTLAP